MSARRGSRWPEAWAEAWDWTPELYKQIGKLSEKGGRRTWVSPIRLQYAVEQFTTRRNFFTDLVGSTNWMVMKALGKEVEEKTMKQFIAEFPGLRRVFRRTPPSPKGVLVADEFDEKINTVRLQHDNKLREMVKNHFAGRVDLSDIYREIDIMAGGDDNEKKRVENNLEWQLEHRGLNPMWQKWQSLRSAEARAESFWHVYKDASPEEKRKMDIISEDLKGFRSERFEEHIRKLRTAEFVRQGAK